MSAILHGGWQDKVFVQLFSIVQKCGIPQKNLLRIQKLPIENKEVGHSNKNVAIEQQEVGHSKENLIVEMIALVDIIKLCDKNHYNRATIHNIEKLYEDIELNQIFSTGYIYKTLACARTTAKNLMSKLREMDIIVPVKGKGKGQYRFKYKSEM